MERVADGDDVTVRAAGVGDAEAIAAVHVAGFALVRTLIMAGLLSPGQHLPRLDHGSRR